MKKTLKRLFEAVAYAGLKPEPGALPPPMTRWQKVRLALAGLFTCAVIAALAVLLTTSRNPLQDMPLSQEGPVDLLPKPLQIEAGIGLAVSSMELNTASTPQQVAGRIRNNGNTAVAAAALELDLLDKAGTKLGSVSTTVRNIGPQQEVPFRVSLPFGGASTVLIQRLRAEEPK